jgi:hypothetical protein
VEGNEAKVSELKRKGKEMLDFVMGVSKEMSNEVVAKVQRVESMMM